MRVNYEGLLRSPEYTCVDACLFYYTRVLAALTLNWRAFKILVAHG